MKTAFIGAQIKSVKKEKAGIKIEGYANRATVDRANEFIPAEAWKDAVANYLKNPILLFNHDYEMPIGKATAISADKDGLKISASIAQSNDPQTSRIRNLVEEGVLSAFSVGMRVGDMERKSDGTVELKDIDLLEVSIVPVGENQDSLFKVIKGAKKLQHEPSNQLLAKLEAKACKPDKERGMDYKEEQKEEHKEKINMEGRTGEAMGHAHHVMMESETGAGIADTIIGEGEAHQRVIRDGEVQPGGADNHVHPLDVDSLVPADMKPEAEESSDLSADEKMVEPVDSAKEDDDFGSPYLEEMQKQSAMLAEMAGMMREQMMQQAELLKYMQEKMERDEPQPVQQGYNDENKPGKMEHEEENKSMQAYLQKLETRLKAVGL